MTHSAEPFIDAVNPTIAEWASIKECAWCYKVKKRTCKLTSRMVLGPGVSLVLGHVVRPCSGGLFADSLNKVTSCCSESNS